MDGDAGWRATVLEHLLEDSPTTVVVLRAIDDDHDAIVELMDTGTATAFGEPVEALIGTQISVSYPERTAEEVLRHLRLAREYGSAHYEAVRDLPAGRQTAAVHLRRLDEDRFLLFASDRSGERQVERRLRHIERVAGVGTYHWNVVRDEVFWSDGVYRIFGEEPASAAVDGARFLERVHPDDRSAQERLIGEVLETGTSLVTTFRAAGAGGAEIIVEVRAEPVSDDGGVLQYVIGTMQDVTERLRYERQAEVLRRSVARRKTALEVHDRIVQGLSTAWLALELGEVDRAGDAIQATTANAQEVVRELLADLAGADGIRAGDLVSPSPGPVRDDPGPPDLGPPDLGPAGPSPTDRGREVEG